MKLSNRITSITESQTLAMSKKSRELQAQGIDIINLSLGEPDFNTPDFIKEAARQALDENYTKYTPVPGYLDLREAICLKLKRDNNLDFNANQIVVSTGAKQSLANVILSVVDPGDEVVIPTPYWVSYSDQVKLAGGICKFVRTTVESDFKITPSQLKSSLTNQTKLLMFSSPCNPTGTVYSKEELKGFAEVIAQFPNLYVICDEIYEHITFVGNHESLAQFEQIKKQVITVNGVSKGFAMTGWRIGYIAASLEIAQACEKMQGQFTSGACSIAQRAAISAMLAEPNVTFQMRDAFNRRRDLVISLLKNIKGLKCNIPAGAFYVFPDISYYIGKKYNGNTINNSYELSLYLLNEGHVALVSGDAFGEDHNIRLSYATSEEKLIEACRRLKIAFDNLQ